MKILKVIHGYPPRYNAGSEVYSQSLCHGLAKTHQVQVFSRIEDPFAADYTMTQERDLLDPNILLNLINLPLERHRYSYRDAHVDEKFAQVITNFKPEIIHIGHLNHLSCSLVEKIPQSIPIVYTLHDYWLLCPRGQFIQRNVDGDEILRLCHQQDDVACARNCYSGYFSRAKDEENIDLEYWKNWVKRRREYITKIIQKIDFFIAPSQYLLERFQSTFNLPNNKLCYLDYGFALDRYANRCRNQEDEFVFGYIGTHIPSKGIQLLIKAYGEMKGNCKLRIWGRFRGQNTEALKSLVNDLPSDKQQAIEWMGEYANDEITKKVFNNVDAIIVPSVWVENSPLVIHEALQAGVTVITADVGGMAEHIHDGKNGLLFTHRDYLSLAGKMQQLLDRPEFAMQLSQYGYLYSDDKNIPNTEDQVLELEKIYTELLRQKHERKND